MFLNSFACIVHSFWVILDNFPAPCHQARDKSPAESHCSESQTWAKGCSCEVQNKIILSIMCFSQSFYAGVGQTELKDLFINPRWTQLHRKTSSKSPATMSGRDQPFGRKTLKQRMPSGPYKKGKDVHDKNLWIEQPRQGYHLQLQLVLVLF